MTDTYKLYTDGSYKNRLNFAGYGGYVLKPDGNKLFEFSEIITDSTLNRKHETLGLARGLELCIQKGIKDLICYTDLKQLALIANTKDKDVQQIYIDRNPTLNDVIDLKKHFNTIKFYYLPRKQNFLADKLSRKAVVELTHPQYANIEPPCQKITFDDTYNTHHNPQGIEHNSANNFFIFSIKENLLSVFLVKKDYGQIVEDSCKPLLTCPTENKKINFWAKKISEVLKDYGHLQKCVIYCHEQNNASGNDFQAVLQGLKVMPRSASQAFIELNQILSQFQAVEYYQPTELLGKLGIINPVKKPAPYFNKNPVKSPEEILEALSLLSQDNYKIGQYPHIENFFPFKKKSDLNVIRLQKLYFNEFFKLSVVSPFSPHEKVLPEIRQQFMQEQIPILKNELLKKGIKLKS